MSHPLTITNPVVPSADLQALSNGRLPVIATDLPVLFEDEGQENMGDTPLHTRSLDILGMGVANHLSGQPLVKVFRDMNLYYNPIHPWAYVSPDLMVLRTPQPLPDDLRTYRVGPQSPAPVLTVEVLSRRSFQQQDLSNKPVIYADLGVAEYILVDTSGEFLPQRLLMKRLVDAQAWRDEQDPDGGITSLLGFRVIFDTDGELRVVDRATGRRYLRPDEAETAAEALAQAIVERENHAATIRQLQEELARLKSQRPE